MQERLTHIQANVAKQLLLHDLIASVETDFEEYAEVVESAPAWQDKRLPPTDPDYNTLGPKNAFWIAIRGAGGDVVACTAQRVWRQANFVEIAGDGRLLYDGTKPGGCDSLHLFAEGLGHIEGNIAYMGGNWVHPRHRGSALPSLSIALAQAKLMQDFDVDYTVSIVRPSVIEKGLAFRAYRYYHMDFGCTMWRADEGERIDWWVLHNSRADIERELSFWVNSAG